MWGADKAGHEGPTGPRYWQGVPAITMEMVFTLVCLLSEVSLGPSKLTKADIVWAGLRILAGCADSFYEINLVCVDQFLSSAGHTALLLFHAKLVFYIF